jgi:glycosyltransferase involved in cell wall biosynthesis
VTGGDRPRLSVVMAVRDGAAELPGQLAGLAAQDPPFAWEIVAVDDRSVDETPRLLGEARDAGLPLVVVTGPGLGMAAARCAGVAQARGELLAFLDHDDEIEPGYLDALAEALDRHELVAARVDCRTLNPGWRGAYRPAVQGDRLADDFKPFGLGGSLAIRRSTYDALGGFDRRLHGPEDRDLCYRAALAGSELVLVPDAVLRYRFRSDRRGIFRQSVRGGRGTVALFRRYRDRGMPPRLLRAEIRRWLDVVVDAVRHRQPVDRARQAHQLGQLVGHLEGCVRWRVWWFTWS